MTLLTLHRLHRGADEADDFLLAAPQRRAALAGTDHGVQHARLGERADDRGIEREQEERGILLADLTVVHPRLKELDSALPVEVEERLIVEFYS